MPKQVVVSPEQLKCLRGHLSAALAIMQELGIDLEDVVKRGQSSGPAKKRMTNADRIKKYNDQISHGSRKIGRRAS